MTCTIITDGTELNTNCRNENESPYNEIKSNLRETIWKLYCEGYTDFYLNCEYGIPLWAAEFICALKIYNEIRLNIIMPYEEQAANWNEQDRDRYFKIHEQADSVSMTSTHYNSCCYSEADKMMIRKSDLVIIFGKASNAKQACDYAKSLKKYIRNMEI